MSNTLDTFEYRNEDDKAYGLAGMVISAGSLDALELVHSVSLDADGPMVRFSEAYHHLLSPSLSPKGVWEQLRRNLYITAAMAVGNLMSRSVVRDGAEVPVRLLGDLHKAMATKHATPSPSTTTRPTPCSTTCSATTCRSSTTHACSPRSTPSLVVWPYSAPFPRAISYSSSNTCRPWRP